MEHKQSPCGCVLDPNLRGQLPQELMDAAMKGDLQTIEAWVSGGGDVNATRFDVFPSGNIKFEVTLLSHATVRNQVDIVSWLLKQESICLNVPVRYNNGLNSPLIMAARGGHADIIDMLITTATKCKLDLKASLVSCGCLRSEIIKHGAIWHAAFGGHSSALRVLLHYHKEDLSQLQDAYFWLAECGMTSKDTDSMKILLTEEFKNYISLTARNSKGEGALYIAAKYENWRTFAMLLEHHSHDVQDLNNSLLEVINHGHSTYLKTFLQSPIKEVIDFGAHDDDGLSLLSIAFQGRVGSIRPSSFTDSKYYLTAGLLMKHHNYPKEEKDDLFKMLMDRKLEDFGDDLRSAVDNGRWDVVLCILQMKDPHDPKLLDYVARQAAFAGQIEVLELFTL